MRRGVILFTLVGAAAFALLSSSASAKTAPDLSPGVQVDVGIFYDNLAPRGDWVEIQDYGWTWSPRVERGWRPYTRGQWILTDDGWFWDSDEPFGWATYHYGRWVDEPTYGWLWVPGTEWAPAWVSWRHGNGYTGWAPLPPRATWQTRIGLQIGALDIDAFIGAGDYTFVHDRSFCDRGVYRSVLPPAQNVTVINVTNNVTNYTVVHDHVVNNGIPVTSVEQAAGRRVPRVRAVEVDRAEASRPAKAGEVAVFRPQVKAATAGKPPAQGKSLIRGEQPPPALVARRNEREAERKQEGSQPTVTAKAAQQTRPAGQQQARNSVAPGTPQKGAAPASPPAQEHQGARPQERPGHEASKYAPRQDDKDARQPLEAAKRESDTQRKALAEGRAKDAQRAATQAQADQRAKEAQQAQERKQQQVERQRVNQERAAQAEANTRAKDARVTQEQNTRKQQAADQQRAKREADAKAKADKRAKEAQKKPSPSPDPS